MASIILRKAAYTRQTSAGKDATGADHDGHVCIGIVESLSGSKKIRIFAI